MILNIYKNHPKKTLLFLIFLFGGVTFKFRVELFNQFLQRMQSKLTREMTLQMEKGQKINAILDKIQITVEDYYAGKAYLKKIQGMLRKEQIQEISNQLKNKKLSKEESKALYQELSNSLLIFQVSSLVLLRNHECLFLMAQIVFLLKDIEQEKLVIQNLLDEVQQTILKNHHIIIEGAIRKEIKTEPERFKYDGIINTKLLLTQMILKCKEELKNTNNWQGIERECLDLCQKKFTQLLEYNQGQVTQIFKDQVLFLVKRLIEVNKCQAIATFQEYAINFSWQKFENRLNLFPSLEELKEKLFIKQLLAHHKMINEEYYDLESENNNRKYYERVIKQGLKIKDEDTQDDCAANIQVLKVLHEYKLFTLLQATQNQIIRKVIFGNELDDQGSSEKQSLGSLQQGGF